jgi:hypothetical protein
MLAVNVQLTSHRPFGRVSTRMKWCLQTRSRLRIRTILLKTIPYSQLGPDISSLIFLTTDLTFGFLHDQIPQIPGFGVFARFHAPHGAHKLARRQSTQLDQISYAEDDILNSAMWMLTIQNV